MAGVIAPGVYLIRNVKSHTVLDVKDAEWNNGKVQGWKVDEANNDPDDQINQRFLITSNPEYPGYVNLLCIRAGAYLRYRSRTKRYGSAIQPKSSFSCFKREPSEEHDESASSHEVVARSTSSQTTSCLWIPEKTDGKLAGTHQDIFRFRPAKNEKLLLSIVDGSSASGAAVVASSEVPEDGLHQCWQLERTDMDLHVTADWMSRVSPQSTKLNMLSIPGTHQTLALNNAGSKFFYTENPKCQMHSPLLQLCYGIRYFDLRLDLFPHTSPDKDVEKTSRTPHLIARHGNRELFYVWEGYSLSAVLQSLAYYLDVHKGEVILVSLRIESARNADGDQWVQTLYEELEPWGSHLYYIDDERVFADLSLEDVRGKAILFSNSIRGSNSPVDEIGHFAPPINNIKRFLRSNERQTVIGADGSRGVIPVSHWESYGESLSANIAKAGQDDNPTHVYRTGLNSSGRPSIGIPLGSFYDPIEFFNWLSENWIPKVIDDQKYAKGARMGLITLDFYNLALDFVKFIIERNPGVTLDAKAPSS